MNGKSRKLDRAQRAEPIRLGLIGCGIAARQLHWPALERLTDRFIITAVCNHTPDKAKSFAALVGAATGRSIPIVLDHRDLLARRDVDAVSVLLPIGLNEPVCRDAVAAGKSILVEKPLSGDLESAGRLVELERRTQDLVMMVAENARYRRVYGALADILRSRMIGPPVAFAWRFWQRIDPATNPYAGTAWRIHHTYEGGFVTDAGVHHVAALREIFGDLSLVGATAACHNPAIGRMDTLTALFRSEGGDRIPPLSGVVDWRFSAAGEPCDRLEVLTTEGRATVGGTRLSVMRPGIGAPAAFDHPDDGGYLQEYLDFHQAIRSGQAPKSTFEKAYSDLATILEAIERAEWIT
jgi:predicted dehydrogenase